MDVTLLYFPGCPSWRTAAARLRVVATERGDLRVTRQLVESAEEAERTGFHGSPTILVDGVDVFAEPGSVVGMACRRYPTPEGYQGAPAVEQLRAVLADG